VGQTNRAFTTLSRELPHEERTWSSVLKAGSFCGRRRIDAALAVTVKTCRRRHCAFTLVESDARLGILHFSESPERFSIRSHALAALDSSSALACRRDAATRSRTIALAARTQW
jgi:hypothetical protein